MIRNLNLIEMLLPFARVISDKHRSDWAQKISFCAETLQGMFQRFNCSPEFLDIVILEK